MRWSGNLPGDFAEARREMVEHQLRSRDITDPRVLEAMGKIPRERFVPDNVRHLAYADEALTIGLGQTISQPYIVATMTQALELSGEEKALEIGTGSGYQAAILAELSRTVFTIERIPELSQRTQETLAELGYTNLHFRVANGTLGWPEEAPFHAIVVTAAAPEIPGTLVEQLTEGGRIVIPVGDRNSQILIVAKNYGGRLKETQLCRCLFVPLLGEKGWHN